MSPLTLALINSGSVYEIPCCGRYSRPGHLTLNKAPGTIARRSSTICETCIKRERRREELARHTRLVSELDAYTRRRHRLGIPPEGLPCPAP